MKTNTWHEIGALCMCSTMLNTGMKKDHIATGSMRSLRTGRK